MNEPQYLVNYIYLGSRIIRLYSVRGYANCVEEVKNFIALAKQLKYWHVAAEMTLCLEALEKAHGENPDAFKDNSPLGGSWGEIVPQEFDTRISDIVHRFRLWLQEHGKEWEVVQIDRSAVSDDLRGLRKGVADEHQGTLVDEAIRCLECGAYRAAIVTGWNLALDHLRQWIFSSPKKRLKELNTVLAAKHRTPSKVEQYEDFFELPERTLIEDTYSAKLFKKNTYNFLISALTTRNGFAHPSRMVATAASAAGYIDSLINSTVAVIPVDLPSTGASGCVLSTGRSVRPQSGVNADSRCV